MVPDIAKLCFDDASMPQHRDWTVGVRICLADRQRKGAQSGTEGYEEMAVASMAREAFRNPPP